MSDRASEKRKLCGGNSDIHLRNTRHKTEKSFHQNNCGGDVETGVSSQEKDFTSSPMEITDVPPLSFEYHGWSEEGINLCVDLNSSPSYWANRYRNEVCVSENACRMNLGCLGGSSTQGKSINENQSTALALVSFAAPNNYSFDAESCAKDVSKKTLNANDTPFIPDTPRHHDSKPGDEIFEDGANDGLPDLFDPQNDLVVEKSNSSEINLDSDGKNLPSLAEEREVAKNVKGKENSECYQFDESLKKCCDQESKKKHRKNRKHRHSEGQSSTDKPDGRFLRSMKKAVTVWPRRSTRLISKVLQQLLH
ncbi:hypothetical protein ACSQ67_011024 [Phaseolus vulgaris]